jgi:hypothetical protein
MSKALCAGDVFDIKPRHDNGGWGAIRIVRVRGRHVSIHDCGIPLAKVTPMGSVPRRGRLSTDPGGGRASIRDARRLPRVPGAAAMAGRLPVSEMRRDQGVAGPARAPRVRRLWPSDLGDGWHDLRPDTAPVAAGNRWAPDEIVRLSPSGDVYMGERSGKAGACSAPAIPAYFGCRIEKEMRRKRVGNGHHCDSTVYKPPFVRGLKGGWSQSDGSRSWRRTWRRIPPMPAPSGGAPPPPVVQRIWSARCRCPGCRTS